MNPEHMLSIWNLVSDSLHRQLSWKAEVGISQYRSALANTKDKLKVQVFDGYTGVWFITVASFSNEYFMFFEDVLLVIFSTRLLQTTAVRPAYTKIL